MDIGEVFNNSKWEIIKDLSEKKFSPMQLAQKYNTTIGNVGHQLRLLEAYGLVKKERICNRNKGKPRTLFSLANNYAYLVSASKGFAEKKLLKLSSYHNTILKMWFIEDSRLHYHMEKFYWKIEDYIDKINGMAVRISSEDVIQMVILTNVKKQLMGKIDSEIIIKNRDNFAVTFNIKFLTGNELKKFDLIKTYHIIYDPNAMLSCYKESFELQA